MALDTNISAEDQMAIRPTPKGPIESDTGPLSMQQQRKQAARTAMAMQGVPKRWKGGGDYFFEMVAPGKLKITGGDSATNLTGGKSVTITDRARISEILEKARGGDILEEGATYQGLYGKEELGEMMGNVQEPAYDSKEELGEMMGNVQEPAYDSKEELGEMMGRETALAYDGPEELAQMLTRQAPNPYKSEPYRQGSLEPMTAVRPKRREGNDGTSAVEDLLARTLEEAKSIGNSNIIAKLTDLITSFTG